MTAFQVGTTYFMRSVCDHNSVWTYTVVTRTAKTVTLRSGGKTIRRGVRESYGVEMCKPLGSYSMCPILGADKVIASNGERQPVTVA